MLLTKLHIPPPGQNLVFREGLIKMLNQGLDRKLILISAPAGYGKTTLLTEWIGKYKPPVGWFSIDHNDNDPVEFLTYTIAAIQRIHKDYGFRAMELLKSSSPPGVEAILSFLINEIIAIKSDFLLVFDDFHRIVNNEVSNLVAYFLDHAPENLHIAIITRSDPVLPIARLRSQNQLVELRSSDLCFSANDINVLFNKRLKFKLSPENLQLLEAKTEGWIAGLQLVAMSMSGQQDISAFIQNLSGDNRYIMDYLMEEVLKIQTDDLKEFLLKTSILEQISAPLCNHVLQSSDSQEILEKLEKSGMFVIPLDTNRHWFRYHHLFADLLKQRLLLVDKSTMEKLHHGACEYYYQNNLYELALEHTLKIKNYKKSIDILGEIVERLWEQGKHSAIIKYGDSLPEEVIKTNPEFCLYYAWIILETGEIKKADPYLESAEKIVTKLILNKNTPKTKVQNYKKFLGKIFVAQALLNSHSEHPDRIQDYSKNAMEYLTDDESLWLGWAWHLIGSYELSKGNIHKGFKALSKGLDCSKNNRNLYLMSTITSTLASHKMGMGQYNSAFQQCADLLAYLKKRGYAQIARAEWTFTGLYTIMSVIQCIRTDFDPALENVKIAYELCKNEKNIAQKIMALLAYTYILHAHEDKKGSLAKLIELEDVMKQYKISSFLVTTYVGWKIYLLTESNQLDQAYAFAKKNNLGLNKKISYENEHSYLHYARLLIADYKLDDAKSILLEIYKLANKDKRVETLVQLKIASAIMYKMENKFEVAVANMVEAMEFASEEHLLNYFLFDLSFTSDLLHEAFKIQATQKTKISKPFIYKLKQAINWKKKRAKMHVANDLSNRELDTLKLLAENLSNPEIANQLFISVNTVKTHLKNIYLKLDVDSRTEAIAKAKDFLGG